MRYLHAMVRVTDLDRSVAFYCDALGLVEVARRDVPQGRFTLAFLSAPDDLDPAVIDDPHVSPAHAFKPALELTYNWDVEAYPTGRNFGHLAFEVDDIYAVCGQLLSAGVMISRPPRDGKMAFVRSPDHISIELLQRGAALTPTEPWISMPNAGEW
ncbi:VOC family protein [Rhizorhabdus dicambivorans]|uniref:Lactoylglutathione lyase n=1 Tax=Rhizorhabdus dicambivorans TaxID=1850238 RepID=A0A2A4FRW3_9SPHN|nr:VOC family protein [Rhizorhabdus dicambivorans]ATE66326.1 lactoylglutathione lyase [Rhizorhabdus dicambivorans]PCE40141.1 lactoylglutathione lyase [Rhizorhabdus dicambivorans]